MNGLIKTIGAAVMVGVVGLATISPAAAAWFPGRHYYHRPYVSYYHPYHRPYYRPYYYDPGAAIATGIIGGIVGTIAGAAIHGGGSHVARCERAYRSYVRSSNTYTGYDGRRHACNL